jgi:hypothetical protein
MTEGPYLYDEGPAPLHTGTPRRRNGLILGGLAATVLVAVGMVAALFVVRGSPAEQAEEAVGVFLSALDHGDTETAHGLLCQAVRDETSAGEVPAEYDGAAPGEVVGSTEAEVGDGAAYDVEVRWDDGATSSIRVINESGARLCGISPAG